MNNTSFVISLLIRLFLEKLSWDLWRLCILRVYDIFRWSLKFQWKTLGLGGCLILTPPTPHAFKKNLILFKKYTRKLQGEIHFQWIWDTNWQLCASLAIRSPEFPWYTHLADILVSAMAPFHRGKRVENGKIFEDAALAFLDSQDREW